MQGFTLIPLYPTLLSTANTKPSIINKYSTTIIIIIISISCITPTMPCSSPLNEKDIISVLSSSSESNKVKALRDLKNQIIGSPTKKVYYVGVGGVSAVVWVLSGAISGEVRVDVDMVLIQCCAVIGSFACGVDAGLQAVVRAGALPLLNTLLYHPNPKVVDAGARSLKLIYQSRLAPKYDFLQGGNVDFVLSLLNSENENISGLGAIIIAHSCTTSIESKVLSDAGVLKRLYSLLGGSLCQRDASLESLATLLGNSDVIKKFLGSESGCVLSTVTEFTKDKNPRTRLLACMCMIVVRNTCPLYLQDVGIKKKLLLTLLELLDDPGQVGEEASFALSNLIAEKEDVQKLAFEENILDKLCDQLKKGMLQAKRVQGILLVLADVCSKLESCRLRFLALQVLNVLTDALTHDSADVRAAACICLKSLSRSVKNLSAGSFMNEAVVIPLVQLLHEPSTPLQVAALGAVSNIVIDFSTQRSLFIKCGGLKQLVQLSKSMESTVRMNSVCALRNLMFLANNKCKEGVFLELSASTLSSLISDPDPLVQEQALALVRNLVDGCMDSIGYVFMDDGLVLHSIGRKMHTSSKIEVLIQGMYVLNNVASGTEYHKTAVMVQLFPQPRNDTLTIMDKCLLSYDNRLRIAALWTLVNLTFPSNPGAPARVLELKNNGVTCQLKNMVNDPCVDVKLRVRTALGQIMTFGDGSP